MSVADLFLLLILWLHLVTAAAWIGGSIFILLVLQPMVRNRPGAPKLLTSAASIEFRGLTNLCILVLIATGSLLALQRLAAGQASTAYAVTLLIKSALTVWMFLIVYFERRRSRNKTLIMKASNENGGWLRWVASGYNPVVILGIFVFGLSDLLKILFEIALK